MSFILEFYFFWLRELNQNFVTLIKLLIIKLSIEWLVFCFKISNYLSHESVLNFKSFQYTIIFSAELKIFRTRNRKFIQTRN